MKKIQKSVKTFGGGSNESLSESVQIPCIILFYPYSTKNKVYVDYCHFDERNLNELKTFTKVGMEKETNKIAFFGGYGSQNITPLLKFFNKNGLVKLVDKDFVSYPPVKNLNFNTEGLILKNVNGTDIFYSFKELKNLFC